jgi:hypothetical protein
MYMDEVKDVMREYFGTHPGKAHLERLLKGIFDSLQFPRNL